MADPLSSEEVDRLLDVPFTFDPLRDPNWQPSREDYRSFRDAAVTRVAELVERVERAERVVEAARELRERYPATVACGHAEPREFCSPCRFKEALAAQPDQGATP